MGTKSAQSKKMYTKHKTMNEVGKKNNFLLVDANSIIKLTKK
jgi:hypothetical protein